MPDRRRPRLWTRLVAVARAALVRLADGADALADGMRAVARERAPARPDDPRLAGVDPAIAAYVASRDPEWFSLDVPEGMDAATRRAEPSAPPASLPAPPGEPQMRAERTKEPAGIPMPSAPEAAAAGTPELARADGHPSSRPDPRPVVRPAAAAPAPAPPAAPRPSAAVSFRRAAAEPEPIAPSPAPGPPDQDYSLSPVPPRHESVPFRPPEASAPWPDPREAPAPLRQNLPASPFAPVVPPQIVERAPSELAPTSHRAATPAAQVPARRPPSPQEPPSTVRRSIRPAPFPAAASPDPTPAPWPELPPSRLGEEPVAAIVWTDDALVGEQRSM
ncbi:hypothetical protein ACH3VR_13545 [Microbacterium sp. B2969]|uniref:Uncharacterized protein n=1 Tax=Microbacterium alkaliflavum TaxID=3248839 RepID=A0ABW7Q939_9MICO